MLPPHICDEIFCIAKLDFCQRLQQNAAGTLQYQGATFGANAKYEYKALQTYMELESCHLKKECWE